MKHFIILSCLILMACQTNQTKYEEKVATEKALTMGSPEAIALEFAKPIQNDFENAFSLEGEISLQAAQMTADVYNKTGANEDLVKLAFIRFQQGKFDEFNSLMKIVKKNVTEKNSDEEKFCRLFLEGLDNERRGFQQKSRAIFRDLTALNNKFIPGYIHLSMAYLKNLKPDVSKFVLSSALEANPKNPKLLNAMGLIHKNMGSNDLALDWFNYTLQMDPELNDALINRAGILLQKEKYAEAKTDLEKALKTTPENPDALMLMAIVAINYDGDVPKGKHMLGQAIRANPSKQLAKMRLAEVYIQEKRELGFAKKLLQSIIDDKTSHYSMIESAKNYMELTK